MENSIGSVVIQILNYRQKTLLLYVIDIYLVFLLKVWWKCRCIYFRRKQQALALVENLKIIQTLENTGKRLDSLLAQDKYPETIKLWLGKIFRTFFMTFNYSFRVRQT